MNRFIVGQSRVVAGGEALFIGHHERSNAGPVHNYTSVGIGTAATDRLLAIAVGASTNNRVITGITCDGVSMAIHDQITGTGAGGPGNHNDLDLVIASIAKPTGTTATFAVTFNFFLDASALTIWRLTGLTSMTPYDTASVSTFATNPSINIDIPNQGILLTHTVGGPSTYTNDSSELSSIAWTGVATQDWDEVVESAGVTWQSAAHEDGMSAEVGRTVTATGTAPGRRLLMGATWR